MEYRGSLRFPGGAVTNPVTHRPGADPRRPGADRHEPAQIGVYRRRSAQGTALRSMRSQVRILSGALNGRGPQGPRPSSFKGRIRTCDRTWAVVHRFGPMRHCGGRRSTGSFARLARMGEAHRSHILSGALVEDVAPVGSEKPIAVWERLTEGPRDSYGRVAGGLMCPGDGPKKGQMAGVETRTGRHARLGYAMACIRRTGRREETFSVNRKIRLRAGRSGDGSRQPAHARPPRPTRVAQPPGHQGSRHPRHGGSAKRGSRMRSSEAPVGDGVR